MYLWLYSLDAGHVVDLFKKYVIGKDPAFCGVSAVVSWSDVEKSKGSFDFSKVEQNLKPFLDAGLTVNLLFAAAGEGKDNTTTPPWVMAEVPKTFCGGVHLPIYWNPQYEADWSAFIRGAITYFSYKSPIKNQVGYMRFATGAGAEAVAPPGAYGGPCTKLLAKHGYSYQVWKAHTLRMLNAMTSVPTAHQIIAALPRAPGGPTFNELPNTFAAAAAAKHVGLSFESLGADNVAAPGTKPGRCQPAKLHWCAAYIKYAGVVPLAMQPITASRNHHSQPDRHLESAAIRARQQDPDLRAVCRRVASGQRRNGLAAVPAGPAGEVQGRIAVRLPRTGSSCDKVTENAERHHGSFPTSSGASTSTPARPTPSSTRCRTRRCCARSASTARRARTRPAR